MSENSVTPKANPPQRARRECDISAVTIYTLADTRDPPCFPNVPSADANKDLPGREQPVNAQ